MTNKPFIICEFGQIKDAQQVAWTTAALSDLLGGRWPRVMGFSWWNSTFLNDPKTGGESNMLVQDNPLLENLFRKDVGENPSVIGRPISRIVTPGGQ
jgi:hypothetical protein